MAIKINMDKALIKVDKTIYSSTWAIFEYDPRGVRIKTFYDISKEEAQDIYCEWIKKNKKRIIADINDKATNLISYFNNIKVWND